MILVICLCIVFGFGFVLAALAVVLFVLSLIEQDSEFVAWSLVALFVSIVFFILYNMAFNELSAMEKELQGYKNIELKEEVKQ